MWDYIYQININPNLKAQLWIIIIYYWIIIIIRININPININPSCPVLYPIGEEFLLSSFREFVHDGYCPVRSPGLCVKLLFSTFLTRNEGTTDESKKRLGCYQQEQFNLPREYSVFDGSQV